MLLLFFLVWVIFNGAITTEILIFGIVVAFLMFGFVCKFMDYSWQKEHLLIMRSWYFLLYLGNLLIEIVKANVAVCHFVLSGTNEIEPVMVSVHCLDRSLADGMEDSSFVKMLEHMERIGETYGNHE